MTPPMSSIFTVTWSPNHVMNLNSLRTVQVTCEAKINQFEAEIRVLKIITSVIESWLNFLIHYLIGEYNIERFDIEVNDIFGMKVVHP